MVDPELEETYPLNTYDMPPSQFFGAAEVWHHYRAGRLEAETYAALGH